jgi:hypothetical protein
MAILADVLAGSTRTRITDRADAYAAIANAVQQVDDAGHIDPARGAAGTTETFVVPITFKAAKLEKVPTRRLIEFRDKERGRNGHEYRTLRHNYLARIEQHVGVLAKANTAADRQELNRVFYTDMEKDFRDLKDELQLARADALFTKDMVTLANVVGAASTLATAFAVAPVPEVVGPTGGAVLLMGVLGTVTKLAKSRREVMRKHPMAYLYQLE